MSREKIDCFQCKHFYITWDKLFPKGCKAMRFKSEKMPAVVVYQASGIACLLFQKKERKSHNLS
jgi:hypothetical protein